MGKSEDTSAKPSKEHQITETPEKPKAETGEKKSPASSKGKETSLTKDAFGRASCDVNGGIECHESHEAFRRGGQAVPKPRSAPSDQAKRKFSAVTESDMVGKGWTVSGASVVFQGRRGWLPSILDNRKLLQLTRRWLPAVGVYMVATAALACWVTEWGEVVNRIPFYKDKEPLPDRPVPSDGDDRD